MVKIRNVSAARVVGGALEPIIAAEGSNGWSPVLAVESQNGGKVLRVAGWVGGSGATPSTGYVGDGTDLESDPINAERIDGAVSP